jgi:hypothetical protein
MLNVLMVLLAEEVKWASKGTKKEKTSPPAPPSNNLVLPWEMSKMGTK